LWCRVSSDRIGEALTGRAGWRAKGEDIPLKIEAARQATAVT
jgi:hypothetical protein